MSRKSALSMRARCSVESSIPLRGYFLSVGGALLLLLLAADWVLPAPLPARLMKSDSALPPIRIHSEVRPPEAVVIDTNRPELVEARPDNEVALAISELPSSDVANARHQRPSSLSAPVDWGESRPVTLSQTLSRARESFAQSRPVAHDRTSQGKRRRVASSKPQRKFAQARIWERQPARHRSFDTALRWCNSSSREHGSCR